jgi:hypothetical protein
MTSGDLYGNCIVYPPDSDRIMFRCEPARMAWYLDRGLAVKLQENPPIIRLTFKPNGPGHATDPYFIQEFINQCVVCASPDDLTHHHIVPYAFRKHFPRDSYSTGRWMYDVLLLCVICHDRYERAADELKEKITAEHGVPVSGLTNLKTDQMRAMKSAAALSRHRDRMPKERRDSLERDLKTYLGKETLSEEDYEVWRGFRNAIETTTAGKLVAERLKDAAALDEFAIRWRKHFLDHMKPRFLPNGWDPERKIYSEPDRR